MFANFSRILKSRRYDVLFIQKGILSTNIRGFDRLVRWANPRLIFDLDDAVYGRNIVEFQVPFFRMLQDEDQAKKISSYASAVVAGNRYLKELALQYNRNVCLIPTPVDTNRFCPRKEDPSREHKDIVIGWIGVSGTFIEYFPSIVEVLQEISRRYPIRLKVITRPTKEPFHLSGVSCNWVPWSYESEVKEMEEFDIGIMPLTDDEWARGKCGLKLLQYMAMGIPSVASRVGTNCEILEDGVAGFLAMEPREWIDKLSRLIEDALLRKKMGEAARKKVVEKYSLEKMAVSLAKLLKEVSRRGQSQPASEDEKAFASGVSGEICVGAWAQKD
jgi:glycosyltransferase involved in cell wall biosynthesis